MNGGRRMGMVPSLASCASGEVELAHSLARKIGRSKTIRTGVSYDEKVANHTITSTIFERPLLPL